MSRLKVLYFPTKPASLAPHFSQVNLNVIAQAIILDSLLIPLYFHSHSNPVDPTVKIHPLSNLFSTIC